MEFKDEPVPGAQQSCPPDPVSKVTSAYFAVRTDGKPPKGKTGPVEVTLTKTKSAIVGSKLWLVVETADLKGGSVTVEILGGDDAAIVAKDAALPVMEGGAEKTSLSAKVGAWAEDKNITNAASFATKAVIPIEIKPDTLEKTKTWRANIGKATDKKSLFHLKVTAIGGNNTDYSCEDDSLENPNKEKGVFLNQKDLHFELYACFCDKEFTTEDIRSFYKGKALFSAKNCPLPADKKTYEEFTKELNAAMKAHSINTCLRKAHFLSQIETESDKLNTTKEYADGWDYDKFTHEDNYNKYKLYLASKANPKSPHQAYNTDAIRRGYNRYNECDKHGHDTKGDGPKYKGKGLIQLTWKDTYESYFAAYGDSTLIDTPEVVASDLHMACDSAAWYWESFSVWGNLNTYADSDDLIYISIGVNGGLNGYPHRKSNVKTILDIMKVKDACINQKVTGKTIGVYKLSTSAMASKKYGKNNKTKIEAFDD